MAVCTITRLHSELCTLTNPVPLRNAPPAESTAAPAMSLLPAKSNKCPKVPLCENAGRVLIICRISGLSKTA